ncbi:MAG: hypothetical protein LC687_04685 [Actinobacteria bacterium]|nr:hypothetical protein [Actinomycetota bacterium]MCA1807130.1 hypothetical protein [Actinomycetota bacterium]
MALSNCIIRDCSDFFWAEQIVNESTVTPLTIAVRDAVGPGGRVTHELENLVHESLKESYHQTTVTKRMRQLRDELKLFNITFESSL